MINKKLMMLTIVIVGLLAVSAVSANEDADTQVGISEINETISEPLDDEAICSSSDEDSVLSGGGDWYEDEWYYDYIYEFDDEGSELTYVEFNVEDNSKNEDNRNIALRLVYEDNATPIENADLAIITDYDYKITKLTTDSNGTAVYNIPFNSESFSFLVGFWYDENKIAEHLDYNGKTLNGYYYLKYWYEDYKKEYEDSYLDNVRWGYIKIYDYPKSLSDGNLKLQLTDSDNGMPIGNVDLAIITNHDFKITRLTTDSNGIAVYDIPFNASGFSFLAGLWYDENQINDRLNYNGNFLCTGFCNMEVEISGANGTSNDVPKTNDTSNATGDVPEVNGTSNATNDGGSFSDIQALIDGAGEGGVIELSGYYNGSGTEIIINKSLTINGNGATLDAGGLSRAFSIASDSVVLSNINFVNCLDSSRYDAVYGGALCWSGDDGSLVNCTFVNCSAATGDNDVYARGGAVYLNGSHASVEGCSFVNCSTVNDYTNLYFHARGVSSYGGALYIDSGAAHASVRNCSFVNSSSRAKAYSQDSRGWSADTSSYSYGGAVYWDGAEGHLEDCSFTNSVADASSISAYSTVSLSSAAYSYGGDVYWDAADGSIVNCSFENSNAKASAVVGHGTTSFDASTYGYGGALYMKGASNVSDCSFVNSSTDVKSAYVKVEGGIDWDVSGTSSRYQVYSSGGAICFDNESAGNVVRCSFVDCTSNGVYDDVIANAKSVAGCSFDPMISTDFEANATPNETGNAPGTDVPSNETDHASDTNTPSNETDDVTDKNTTHDTTDTKTDTQTTPAKTATETQTKTTPKATSSKKTNTVKLTLTTVKVKKSAKKLVIKATLKINNKAAKGKKITFKFNGKKYVAKTNKKGVAKITVKKSVLKKLKVGKKIKYQASYGKKTVKKTVKVKK